MEEIMKQLILFVVVAVVLTGCGRNVQTASTPEPKQWEAPALPEKQQELILTRAVELMKESGKWQGYPLKSMGFDNERKQWKLEFSSDKPDGGYHIFIADEKADRIDILLFPPMWTEYERKKSSNQ